MVVLDSEDIIVLSEFMVTLLQYFCSQIINMIIFSLIETSVESRDFFCLHFLQAAYMMSHKSHTHVTSLVSSCFHNLACMSTIAGQR